MTGADVFRDLMVLELANNHWGSLERGFRIVRDFGAVVRANGVRAAMKLQFRDVDGFVHRDFRERTDLRYVRKTLDTRLDPDEQARLVEAVRREGMVTMATPFDEASVARCVELDVAIIKIASADIRDRSLLPRILETGRPAIMSTGGSSLAEVDAVVAAFADRGVPLAINHCVSLYPTEDAELELNQVDFLRARYPRNVIGFSTHEYRDWRDSMLVAYAKGARTFERHVDVEADGIPVSPYCSRPEQIDAWFKAFAKARALCGGPATAKRVPPEREVAYLDALVRGVYARRPIARGARIGPDDVYFAVPLQRGQVSVREFSGEETALSDIPADAPVRLDAVEAPYARDPALAETVRGRGLPSADAPRRIAGEGASRACEAATLDAA
jgi:sialic acid synthase SpsE